MADVGIQGERVVAIGDLSGLAAHRTTDVSALVVSPGFIDVHAHRATFAEPHRYAQGFEIVLANGRIVLEKWARTDELPGKVLLGAHGARA